MGITFAGKGKEADEKTELAIAIEQWELEYGKMTPEQKFIYTAGWDAGRFALRVRK